MDANIKSENNDMDSDHKRKASEDESRIKRVIQEEDSILNPNLLKSIKESLNENISAEEIADSIFKNYVGRIPMLNMVFDSLLSLQPDLDSKNSLEQSLKDESWKFIIQALETRFNPDLFDHFLCHSKTVPSWFIRLITHKECRDALLNCCDQWIGKQKIGIYDICYNYLIQKGEYDDIKQMNCINTSLSIYNQIITHRIESLLDTPAEQRSSLVNQIVEDGSASSVQYLIIQSFIRNLIPSVDPSSALFLKYIQQEIETHTATQFTYSPFVLYTGTLYYPNPSNEYKVALSYISTLLNNIDQNISLYRLLLSLYISNPSLSILPLSHPLFIHKTLYYLLTSTSPSQDKMRNDSLLHICICGYTQDLKQQLTSSPIYNSIQELQELLSIESGTQIRTQWSDINTYSKFIQESLLFDALIITIHYIVDPDHYTSLFKYISILPVIITSLSTAKESQVKTVIQLYIQLLSSSLPITVSDKTSLYSKIVSTLVQFSFDGYLPIILSEWTPLLSKTDGSVIKEFMLNFLSQLSYPFPSSLLISLLPFFNNSYIQSILNTADKVLHDYYIEMLEGCYLIMNNEKETIDPSLQNIYESLISTVTKKN
ncbi:hypothetical protein WA158_002260 [Blastocystis sp. Blastoise]